MAELKYEIVENLGSLGENARGWSKELNLISWNEKEPKYDIRDWAPDHSRMGKGVTLTADELAELKQGCYGSAVVCDGLDATVHCVS